MLKITTLDSVIIIGFLLSVIAIGVAAAKRASKSASDFFLSGRSMPWWLLGVSMVACTFSCDTPNLVTDIVRSQGVAGNWAWWAFLLTGLLTVFVYAKLWRRSALDTDLGFYEIRYSGTPASALRGFRAVYLGLFFNVIITGAVSLAAIKIGAVVFGLEPVWTLVIALAAVGIYSTLGGLTGSIWADFYQYSVAMVGAVAAAYFAVKMVGDGGQGGTMAQMFSDAVVKSKMAMFPAAAGAGWKSTMMTLFILPIAVQWWATWYPGAEPGGGGYIAQRMLSAKDEKNAVGATLLFNFLHYALRSWPWLIVALASLMIFPLSTPQEKDAAKAWLQAPEHRELVQAYDKASAEEKVAERFAEVRRQHLTLSDLRGLDENAFRGKDGQKILSPKQVAAVDKYMKQDLAYPAMIAKVPKGWLGLIIASLIAAYMSTIATQLNWGSSYLVQDFYTRFINKNASPKNQVLAGRLFMILLLVLTGVMALILQNAKGAFDLMLQVGAGTGLLYILRWFWWRINSWSEISAMVISFAVACFFQFGAQHCGLVSPDGALEATGWLETGWRAEWLNLSAWKLILGVLVTTLGWLAVTFLTPPEKKPVLQAFCQKIRAGGPGWRKVVADLPELAAEEKKTGWDVPTGILCMLIGCLAVWCCLFGVGYLLYGIGGVPGDLKLGIGLLAVSVAATAGLMKLVGKIRLS